VKFLNVLIALICIVLLQTQVLDRFYWGHFIDLFLLLNVYFSLGSAPMPSMGVALFSGIVQDTFSQGIIGMNGFSKTVVAYLVSSLSARLMIKHPLIIMLLVALATAVDFLILYGLHRLFSLKTVDLSGQTIGIASTANALAGSVLFQIVERIRLKKEYA
jgi:rod shape-determining protein MreD